MNKRNLQTKRALCSVLFVLLLSAGGMMKALAQPTGAINGLFSVSENNQVYFSQGNLQYQASTNTWRFAENQWDCIREGNSNISSTYDGWIDLFNWGTSGYNHGANCYQPWSTSTDVSNYYAYGVETCSLFDQMGKADWGYNAISNGGNQEGLWRTLSYNEWHYMLYERETSSNIRFAKAQVNGVNGLIVLPDDWDASNYTLNNTNNGGASFDQNNIAFDDWMGIFQDAGATFLPCAGARYGNRYESYSMEGGDYWSSTRKQDGDFAYDINLGLVGHSCCNGEGAQSVRLVRPAQTNTSYSIEAVSNPAESGTITGTGTYEYYTQVTLTATANEGYTFYQWKENGNVISTDNPYSFVALFDRNLEACFLENNTYPLLYSYNDGDHTATVTGRWDGVQLEGELVIPETVMHNGEAYMVTAIGSNAFNRCSGLTSVIIPNTVNYLGDYAFYGCSGIVGELVIPSSITSISNGAFEYCGGLTSVNMGTSVTSIGDYAFRGCSSFTSLEIPNTVTTIGAWAFNDCSGLTSVAFPDSLNFIGNWAFRYCNSLTEVVIPSSVTSIGVNPFAECSNLAQITVESGNAYYDSRDDSHAIIEIATNKLISGSLSTVIPQTVTSLGQDAFYGMPVSSITFPASVNYIGEGAIMDNALLSITVLGDTPPALGYCAFCNVDKSIPVYVPCGSVEAYQNAEGWNEFTNFIEMCPGTITVTANPAEYGTVTGGSSFEGGETCTVTATPNEGCFFAYWSENGQMVSAETTYSFIVAGDRNLIALFYTNEPGMLNGLFSVSENTLVCFSQGNLQYQASTNTWRFAENQWDYVGNSELGTVYENGVICDNSLISSSYNGWIDLFGWGTSRHDHGAVCYQPWCTNENNGEYVAYGQWQANLFDQTGQADWGSNAISNGGNQTNQWRTLTSNEWAYLFDSRNTTSGIRWTKGNVNGVNGVIMLPDNWDVTLYTLNDANGGYYSSNTISAEDWTNFFETNGAVFLPTAAQRVGTWVRPEGSYNYDFGVYWSSSWCNDDNAYSVYLNPDGLSVRDNWQRCIGRSVRLVRPAQTNTSYSIEAVSNPAESGTITGTGTYEYYTQVTLTATANEDYTFYQWKENGNVISTDNPYSFVALFDRNLEACFLENNTYPLLFSYNDDDHTATVIGHWDGQNASGEVIIPETVVHNGETYTVTAIGNYAFCRCDGLTGSLTIPNSVTSIGYSAFKSCSGFTGSLTIPNSVTSIGDEAFSGCSGFTGSLTIPSSVTSIGNYAFYGCSGFTGTLTIPSSVTRIYDNAFAGCSGFTGSLTIPSSVTSISRGAFYGCSGFTGSLTIPSSVTSIGDWAFSVCSGFTGSLTIPSSVTSIGFRAFWNCSSFTGSLTIPNSVTSIGDEAFSGCSGFTGSLTIPSSVTSIGEFAFYGCSGFTGSLTIPSSVTEIGRYAFSGCSGFTGSLTIPNSVTSIGERAFEGCSGFTGPLTIPNSVTSIAGVAFSNCNGFTGSLTIPNSVTSIGWSAFSGCSGFTSMSVLRETPPTIIEGQWGSPFAGWSYSIPVYVPCGSVEAYQSETCWNMFTNIQEGWFDISVVVNMDVGGLVEGEGNYCLGSTCTLTATANANFVFLNWTDNGEVVSTSSIYTFSVAGQRTLVANFGELTNYWEPESNAFEDNMTLTCIVQLDGVEQATSMLEVGAFCGTQCRGSQLANYFPPTNRYIFQMTIFGESNDEISFRLYDHQQNQELLLTPPAPITFTTNGYGSLINPYVLNFTSAITHTQALNSGWNWWSTYIELNNNDGLSQLENSIGEAGIMIKSRTNGYVEAYEYNGATGWFGTLDSIRNEQMYKIRTNAACNATVEGLLAVPANHPISINSGWNWIGFPCNQNMNVDMAMSGFIPEANDVIKGRNGFTTYYSDENYSMWYGTLNTLEPGRGYMYRSNSTTQKTLVFQTGRGETTMENVTTEDNIFQPADENFADNMTVTAVLELDGEELRSDDYELAAFVGDECRGSVRLMYVEPVNRYVAFLTVFGEPSETLYFRLTDGTQTELSMDEITFAADGMEGTLSEPMTLRFGTTKLDENEWSKVLVYPNPSNGVFNIQGQGIRKIEVFNAFGQAVVSEETSNDHLQIDLSRYADGCYMLRVVTDNGIINRQLIRK